MNLVVTHEQPDFDAIASLALARRLHPGSLAALHGAVPRAVRELIALYRDELDLLDGADVDLTEVDGLIVVDTADPGRLGPFAALLGSVPVTLYDHHPRPAGAIDAGHGLQERVGATATLLVRQLRRSGAPLPPSLASLALLGIHEDTGSFRYALTSGDDHQAAAYLLGQGASMELVRRFLRDPYEAEHRQLMARILDEAEVRQVAGHPVATAVVATHPYLPDVAGLANRMLELFGADAAVLVVRMDERTLVFARGERVFDLGAALASALGGGGHPGAAFARSDLSPEAALEVVLEALPEVLRRVPTARELMSHPVRSASETTPVSEAHATLVRFGHNGLPVQTADGALVGVVSRRDLERALRHGMGDQPVERVMRREVVTASPETRLDQLERLVIDRRVGRLPIVEDGQLVGIVTRSDLLAARHPPRERRDTASALVEGLPDGAQRVLELAAQVLEDGRLYLVGGTVRDALLGRGLEDLDLMVEGTEAETFGRRLQRRLGGKLASHRAFGTSSLRLPSGLTVDVAEAREEVYAHPGALPSVARSSLGKDLARRDFTVNALALRVRPDPPLLIDPYDGAEDLRRGLLRVLHPLSFVEDPTRILRGARLAGRLGFRFEPGTEARARAALAPEILDGVSAARLRAELELTLVETRVAPALAALTELGALEAIFAARPDAALFEALDRRRAEVGVPDESYLLALLLGVAPGDLDAQVERYHWPRRVLSALGLLRQALAHDRLDPTALERLGPAGRALLRARGGPLGAQAELYDEAPGRRRLRGRDVVELGLAPGPDVGRVLDAVAAARAERRVRTFDDELELARRLVAAAVADAGGSDA